MRYALALTGGIATGKSSAAEIFSTLGYDVVDADKVAHRLLDDNVDKIADTFGEKFVQNGRVDRKALGSLVFADKAQRERLEGLMHPLIRDEILDISAKLDKKSRPYLIELPLFFETGAYEIDNSILVYAPREMQLKRLMTRNNLSKKEANDRIDSQMDIESKKAKAKYIIDNTKDMAHLNQECQRVDKLIREDMI